MDKPIYYDDQFVKSLGKQDYDDMILAGYLSEGWYFWDETQAFCYGPFKSQFDAEAEMNDYIKWLNKLKVNNA